MKMRYDAFLSYSRQDAVIARKIQEFLETYRPPDSSGGKKRLRIFRDDSDLTASPSLRESISEAIRLSECLVILCSPSSVDSQFVSMEIQLFRAAHGDKRMYLILIDGEPEEAIPGRLLSNDDPPLYVDLRHQKSQKLGFERQMLRVVAGLLQQPLDALVKRNEARRRKSRTRAWLLAVSFIALLLVTTAVAGIRTEIDSRHVTDLDVFYGGVERVRFAAGSYLLGVGTNGGIASLWRTTADRHEVLFWSQTGSVRDVAVWEERESVVIAVDSWVLEVRGDATDPIRRVIQRTSQTKTVARSSRSDLWMIGEVDGTVCLADLSRAEVRDSVHVGAETINGLYVSSEDQGPLVHTSAGRFLQVDHTWTSFDCVWTSDSVRERVTRIPPLIDFERQEAWYATVNGVSRVNLGSGTEIECYTPEPAFNTACMALLGNTLALCQMNGKTFMIDVASGEMQQMTSASVPGMPESMDFSFDGMVLAVGYRDPSSSDGGVVLFTRFRSLWGFRLWNIPF